MHRTNACGLHGDRVRPFGYVYFANLLLLRPERQAAGAVHAPGYAVGPEDDRSNPPPANDQVKFATYTRDSATGLDYADQRYYGSTYGRFASQDQYVASGGPASPQSWNRYAYTRGDHINRKTQLAFVINQPILTIASQSVATIVVSVLSAAPVAVVATIAESPDFA
jgi:RHS repeat-associated protein